VFFPGLCLIFACRCLCYWSPPPPDFVSFGFFPAFECRCESLSSLCIFLKRFWVYQLSSPLFTVSPISVALIGLVLLFTPRGADFLGRWGLFLLSPHSIPVSCSTALAAPIVNFNGIPLFCDTPLLFSERCVTPFACPLYMFPSRLRSLFVQDTYYDVLRELSSIESGDFFLTKETLAYPRPMKSADPRVWSYGCVWVFGADLSPPPCIFSPLFLLTRWAVSSFVLPIFSYSLSGSHGLGGVFGCGVGVWLQHRLSYVFLLFYFKPWLCGQFFFSARFGCTVCPLFRQAPQASRLPPPLAPWRGAHPLFLLLPIQKPLNFFFRRLATVVVQCNSVCFSFSLFFPFESPKRVLGLFALPSRLCRFVLVVLLFSRNDSFNWNFFGCNCSPPWSSSNLACCVF